MRPAALARVPLVYLNLRLRSRTWALYKQLRAEEQLSEGAVRRIQARRLESLLRHAYAQVPYYRWVAPGISWTPRWSIECREAREGGVHE